MLGRIMSWCVPDSALKLQAPAPETANLQQALSPYQEDTRADTGFKLRVVHD
jgi:hypothetical protein